LSRACLVKIIGFHRQKNQQAQKAFWILSPAPENALFLQLFLCLSRACLGKMIVFSSNRLKKGVFGFSVSLACARVLVLAIHQQVPRHQRRPHLQARKRQL
jgi:hypothetical protein